MDFSRLPFYNCRQGRTMNYLWDNLFRRGKKVDDIRSLLRDNILFQDLAERELRFVESLVHVRRFHAGEPVFRQGEVGVGMYLIAKGRIEIFVSDPNAPAKKSDESRDIFITQLTANDFFGELALVEDNGRRTASALARDESLLIGFFKPDLTEVLERNPEAGIKISLRLAEVLGQRLKETTEKVSELRRAIKDLREPPPLDPQIV
jgi:CRP/FNR family cyclic AMP-dependent transcriptional regulator